MPSQAVEPLRIQKSTPNSSPNKMNKFPAQRPLTELSPMERRRNSPSFTQATKGSAFSGDSSPFDPSPYNPSNGASPRLFWQGRDPRSPNRFNNSENSPLANRESSPSPTRRNSIEHLKRASRVKNSNMFAREHQQDYDPAAVPNVERPLATGRSLGVQMQGNANGGRGFDRGREETMSPRASLQNGAAYGSRIPMKSPGQIQTNAPDFSAGPRSPSKPDLSPTKSSLSKNSRYSAHARAFDPENETWSDEDSDSERQLPPGRVLHRHAKSVTFDVKPPQINEYEMTTPDLSSVGTASRDGSYDSAAEEEEGDSYQLDDSMGPDDSFDASLEDTAKTPVVGPEDWRFMSPSAAGEGLAGPMEDPFDGDCSPLAEAKSPLSHGTRPDLSRTDSAGSSGDHRPLPPLPGASPRHSGSHASHRLSLSSPQRSLPTLPAPASISKSDIQSMGGGKMSLEDRLRLMMVQDEDTNSPNADTQRERRMRRGHSREQSQDLDHSFKQLHIKETEIEQTETEASLDVDSYQLPPRISRESILRKVKGQTKAFDDLDFNFSSPAPSSPAQSSPAQLNPDTPLQSTEFTIAAEEASVVVKEENEEEADFDVYSIPEMYNVRRSDSAENEPVFESAQTMRVPQEEQDDASQYSRESVEKDISIQAPRKSMDDDCSLTPKKPTPTQPLQEQHRQPGSERMSLPEFTSILGEDDFDFGLSSYMTPPLPAQESQRTPPSSESIANAELPARPTTPEAQTTRTSPFGQSVVEDDPPTPESVIRHSIPERSSVSPPVPPKSAVVPEPIATIKAPGGRLKTRPSATPADLAAMSAARRQISGDHSSETPEVPQIPNEHKIENGNASQSSGDEEAGDEEIGEDSEPVPNRRKSLVKLNVPMGETEDDLGFGLDKEFDRLIEAKKKGYLMRQNTKVIVASSNADDPQNQGSGARGPDPRGTRSVGNSPVKSSNVPSQTWSVEPWNGKVRRKSIRQASGNAKKPMGGPVPPLPGQESNVAGLGSVDEADTALEEIGEDEERGRLFVKVAGLKDLNLPLPKNERTWFRLTLDNGVHCVTTAWLELGKTAPIGQEFELVVLDELEFTLTLETKLEPPKHQAPIPLQSAPSSPQKKSTFSRVFGSPKKRKELEKKQQEDDRAARQRQQDAHAKRLSTQPTAWDLLHNLVAQGEKGVEDGTFARAYVSLKEHEGRAFGRPYSVDVACFNEWATEPNPTNNSLKTKQGGVQRRAPYRIGKLDLQLLYIPKPKGATDDDMPKSLNACVRQLKEAETSANRKWEGCLSQQGGDCPYWRRRFFKLDGSKLTAYHEATLQPRATINLGKASKLIDDRSSLVQKEVSAKSRRKSAFAEEEEGYMFVEEGFRIRFANGEVIDFYADSAAEKEGWMKVLAETVGKDSGTAKSWTEIVLSREKKSKELRSKPAQGMVSAPATPHGRPKSYQPAPATEKGIRQQGATGHGHMYQSRVNGGAPRSMLF
ncbi:MAG: RNA helicase [Chaenotheca gracillima]|nr:MAG: RNA helicase [Chaenotheca gracillima]